MKRPDRFIAARVAVEKAKRRPGRPSLTGETGQRYQVTIPPTVEAKLREYGSGSLSAGIIKAAKRIRSPQSPGEQHGR